MATARYSLIARILHWVVGVLVIGQIALGFITDAAPRDEAGRLGAIHAQIGIMVLALVVLRLTWRIAVPLPSPPLSLAPWQRLVSGIVHRTLYVLLLAMPLSGLAVWMWIGTPVKLLGVVPLPLPRLAGEDEFWLSVAGYIHEFGALAISALVALHIAAALWHEFVLRDRLIRRRML